MSHPHPEGQADAPLWPDRDAPTPDALPLLYEDADLLAVHKPAGLLVHRTQLDAHETDTVLERLRRQLGDAADGLAPAHRLDKGTSGVLLLARHPAAARALGDALEGRACDKRYLALVRGWPADDWATEHPLARDPERPSQGQPMLAACTRGRTLARAEWPLSTRAGFAGTRVALVEARPESGRRHQIRRHLKHLGHPLIGDATHGKGPLNRALAAWLGQQRLWLHALSIGFRHPATGAPMRLHAEPGPEWMALPGVGVATPRQ